MQYAGVFLTLLFPISSAAPKTGEELHNRGPGLDSLVDTRVGRKVTRRIRRHATRQLVSEETTQDGVQGGTGVAIDDLANGEDNLDGFIQDYSQPAARMTQEKNMIFSSFPESVASLGARFSAEDGEVTSVDREKHAQERESRTVHFTQYRGGWWTGRR